MDQQRHTIEVLQKALHDKVCVDVCTCRSSESFLFLMLSPFWAEPGAGTA